MTKANFVDRVDADDGPRAGVEPIGLTSKTLWESNMPLPHLHTCVRLTEDIPTLWLRSGDHGTVVSVWLVPGDPFFEVEFQKSAQSPPIRALLRSEQLEVVEPHVVKVETRSADLTEPTVLANCGFSARLLATYMRSRSAGGPTNGSARPESAATAN